MVIVRCCASLLVFLSLVMIALCLGGGGYWLYWMKGKYDPTTNDYKYCEIGSYVLWGLDGLYLLILLCLCNRIRLGLAIIKCTA